MTWSINAKDVVDKIGFDESGKKVSNTSWTFVAKIIVGRLGFSIVRVLTSKNWFQKAKNKTKAHKIRGWDWNGAANKLPRLARVGTGRLAIAQRSRAKGRTEVADLKNYHIWLYRIFLQKLPTCSHQSVEAGGLATQVWKADGVASITKWEVRTGNLHF